LISKYSIQLSHKTNGKESLIMTPKYPLTVSDYTVFAVQLPPVPSFSQTAYHFFYIRPHEPKLPDADSPRSLFVANVPITSTETHFRHLFGTQLSAGRVERVEFRDAPEQNKKPIATIQGSVISHKSKKRKRETAEDIQTQLESAAKLPPVWDRELRPSGSHAVVVFVDRASMEASLKAVKAAAKSRKDIIWGEGIEDKLPPLGAQRYRVHEQLKYPAKSELLNTVGNYMTLFSKLEEAKTREVARAQEPDEDGFITVTRGPKSNPIKEEELRALAEKQKAKNKGLEDFYRFQMREKRKERQSELLKKFEEDKKKVEEMKMRRGRMKVDCSLVLRSAGYSGLKLTACLKPE
jgi:hypothetical protein